MLINTYSHFPSFLIPHPHPVRPEDTIWFISPMVYSPYECIPSYSIISLNGNTCPAWYSKGLKISTAMHSANNILSALTISLSTTITLWDSAEMIIQMMVIVVLILILAKKFNFFKFKSDA